MGLPSVNAFSAYVENLERVWSREKNNVPKNYVF